MAFAIRVNVRANGVEILDITVRENNNVYGLTRNTIMSVIHLATKCNQEEYQEHLFTAVYNARLRGTSSIVIETDTTYEVSLVHNTEDLLAGYNLVGYSPVG